MPRRSHEWTYVGHGEADDGRLREVGFCVVKTCHKYRLDDGPAITKAAVKRKMLWIKWGDGETISRREDGHKAFIGL